MKKFAFVFLASLLIMEAAAQNASVISAFNYLGRGQFDKAKAMIDPATVNVQTSGQARTWFYRGNIYLSIYLSPKYKSLDTNALQVAYDSYQKAIEIDKDISLESLNPPTPIIGLYVVGEQFYNQGVDLYNLGNYTVSMEKFEMTRKINNIFSIKDTIATFNAALCALQLNDIIKSKQFLEDLAKNQYHNEVVYSSLSNIYKTEGDTAKALSIILKGRKLMGDNLALIIAECNIYLGQGKTEEAQNLLKIAVEKDPNNHLLHYNIGVNLAEFGSFEEAEKSYLKAIELKPDYFDAMYNLGALYVNTAASILEKANALPVDDTEGYNKLKAKADDLLNKAIPTLEKAEVLQPTDLNTLYTLKQLYTRTNNMEKLKVVDEKIKGLK